MSPKLLVVEDDEFKAKDLLVALGKDFAITVVGSVRDAVVCVMRSEFDLVVLDMALPTFTASPSSAGGTAQAQGGVEVVRAIKAKASSTAVVIVSQYPDVEIDGKFVALEHSAEALSTRYGVRVIGAVEYDFQDTMGYAATRGDVRVIRILAIEGDGAKCAQLRKV